MAASPCPTSTKTTRVVPPAEPAEDARPAPGSAADGLGFGFAVGDRRGEALVVARAVAPAEPFAAAAAPAADPGSAVEPADPQPRSATAATHAPAASSARPARLGHRPLLPSAVCFANIS